MSEQLERMLHSRLIQEKDKEIKILTEALVLLESQPFLDCNGLDAAPIIRSNLSVRLREYRELIGQM